MAIPLTGLGAADWSAWAMPALVAVALLCVLKGRKGLSTLVCGVFVVSVSAALSLAMVRWWPSAGGMILDVSCTSAALALVWSAFAGGALWLRRLGRSRLLAGMDNVARTVSLLLAVVAAVLQSFVLVVHIIGVGIDLGQGYPDGAGRRLGFGPEGMWALLFLFVAGGIALLSTRDRRLGICQLWLGILLVSWVTMLVPPLGPTPTGGWERTAVMLFFQAALALVLIAAVVLTRWLEWRRRWRLALTDPDALAAPERPWPGLPMAALVIGLAVLLLACYQLAVPVVVGRLGFRGNGLIIAGSTALAALACFLLTSVAWHRGLAEVALALSALAFCGVATVVVPEEPRALAERYPMIFNAVLVGLALSLAFWTWLGQVWRQQLDDGRPWTTAGRMISPITRFVFYNGAMALVVATTMALWPRWPGIAATDDSLGRVAAGLAGNLLLLLVMLWCSRYMRRSSFQILTVLTLLSAAGFLVARMLPFTPRFG